MSQAHTGAPTAARPPRILVAAAPGGVQRRLVAVAESRGACTVAVHAGAARAQLASGTVAVVLIGPALEGGAGAELAGALADGDVPWILLIDGAHTHAAPIAGQSWCFTARAAIGDDALGALVDAAIRGCARAPDPQPIAVDSRADATRIQRILDAVRQLATHREPEGAAYAAVEAAIELAGADSARCLFYDEDSGALYDELGDDGSGELDAEDAGSDVPAVAGLLGFCARTGVAVAQESAAAAAGFYQAVDSRFMGRDDRVLVQPVVGAGGQTHAVLVALRRASQDPFGDVVIGALSKYAAHAGSVLDQLSLRIQAQELLDDDDRHPFRPEALEAYRSAGEQGDLVRVSPAWVQHSYWPLSALLVIALVYLVAGKVDQYTAGPAVIRAQGWTDVTANVDGTVSEIAVQPADRVAADQVLARLYSAEEASARRELERQWEAQLRQYLLDPDSESTRRELAALRVERARAQARLQERVIRAPHAGVVGDVRTRIGQHLAPGDAVLGLRRGDDVPSPKPTLLAFLPGGDAPQIEPGMTMRLELPGYPYAYQEVTVESVDRQVIGPAEVRRYVGPQLADSIALGSAVVVVRATLPADTFEADGELYSYYDGMPGRVELRIRSERIIVALIPGLKQL